MQVKQNMMFKRIVDVCMTVLLLCLMAYQVTGEALHEWIGIGMTKVSFARRMHLSMSHWSFVLMGLHLGLHIPVMIAKLKLSDKLRMALSVLLCIVAGTGLCLSLKNNIPDYLLFRVPFAFLDYEKAGILVFFENILMLLLWAFIGNEAAALCRNSQMKAEDKKNPRLPVIFIMGAIIFGLIFNKVCGVNEK